MYMNMHIRCRILSHRPSWFCHFQEAEINAYQQKLKEATWVPHLFRVSVTQNEYNNEKRQRITVRAVAPIDFAEESRFLLEEIKKMRNSQ